MRIYDPHVQQRIDLTEISRLRINLKSRDEMTKICRGVQAVYADELARGEILALIAKDVLGPASPDRGRMGLDLWSIFVLLAVRQARDYNYDQLEDAVDNHRLVRQMMGVSEWDSAPLPWMSIWRNLNKVGPSTIEAINRRVLRVGHQAAPWAVEKMRCDSFVMQTYIHHPNDVRQADDGLKLVIRHGSRLANLVGSTLLRQAKHLDRRRRSLARAAGEASASRGRGRDQRLKKAVSDLYAFGMERVAQALRLLDATTAFPSHLDAVAEGRAQFERSQLYFAMSATVMCLEVANDRLVLDKETALTDRLYSVFEPHTELIHRGKTPNPVEFGHRVLVVEDAAGFVTLARTLSNGRQDRDVVPTVLRMLKRKYPELVSVSFDRGFHSPENQRALEQLLPKACLPTPGIHAAAKQSHEKDEEWHSRRRHHPGIEAKVGVLGLQRGCQRIRDRSRRGGERVLAAAMLSENLFTLGRILLAQEHPNCTAGKTRRRAA